MSTQQDQRQQQDAAQGEPHQPRSGEGSDSAMSAMLKKRREGPRVVNEEVRDQGDKEAASNV
jgi:hypothetical protein